MKKTGCIWIIFLIFLALRLASIDSVYLWLDEVDFLGNTFEGEEWTPVRFVPFDPDQSWRVIGEGTWMEAVETSVLMAGNLTTAPWFPVFLLHLLIRIFGHHLLLLRLPALVVSVASLFLLRRILARLFRAPGPRILPLVIFTFSLPAIIYGQSPQPVIYYFFSTVVQTWVLVDILQGRGEGDPIREVARGVRRLARISLLTFFLNYMSVLLCVVYIAFYLAAVLPGKNRRRSPGDYGRVAGEIFFGFLPLAVLSFLRYRVGDHRIVYEVDGLAGLARLIFEFLTYNFNFAYTPAFYRPLGLNPAAWPLIITAGGGLVYFLTRYRKYLLPSLVGLGILFGFIFAEIMPFGPVRHTLTIAPLLYLLAGFGIEGLGKFTGLRVRRLVTAVLVVYVVGIFAISGREVYRKQRPVLDLEEIVQLARANRVTTVAGYKETVLVLALMSRTEGDIFSRSGIRLTQYDPVLNSPTPERHLLVAYRHMFEPRFPGLAWRVAIPREDYRGREITPLKEDPGPLPSRPDIMAHQSIYYPLNGAFIYLVEP